MKTNRTMAAAAGLVLAMPAAGQTATASLSAGATTVAPGSSVSVSLIVDFTVGSAGPGLFGPAGLYGFGGSVEASGAGAADAQASSVATAPGLALGATSAAVGSGGPLATAAAGRLLADGGISSSPQTVLTFDLNIDAGATAGDSVTIAYDGAVVLSLDDSLVTFSTTPGPNQQTLSVTPLVITIGSDRLCADVNDNGVAEPGDFTAWVAAYNAGDLRADANQNGANEPGDFTAWVAAYNQGAAGPTCTP